jgi:ABC-type iron transport system FetAB ATPase subunit
MAEILCPIKKRVCERELCQINGNSSDCESQLNTVVSTLIAFTNPKGELTFNKKPIDLKTEKSQELIYAGAYGINSEVDEFENSVVDELTSLGYKTSE